MLFNLAFATRPSANALQPRNTELALVSSSVDVCALTSAQNIKRTATAIPMRHEISSSDAMAYPLVAEQLEELPPKRSKWWSG
jgi:hypothetical protein